VIFCFKQAKARGIERLPRAFAWRVENVVIDCAKCVGDSFLPRGMVN